VIDGLSVLALIPARGGSKGLPGKNIRLVGGRPLLAFTADAACRARCVDRVVLSTDDDAIAQAGLACGCDVPFRRPASLATDTASSIDVVLHALDAVPGYDIVVLLQPTSPARAAQDIDDACRAMLDADAASCVSVARSEQSPYWMYRLDARGRLQPLLNLPPGITRRQDLPTTYTLNGAVYVARTGELRRSRTFMTSDAVAHAMPPERSIDIDTLDDFEAFERLLARETR
jgi:CMP-N,N'-diacetyllegionaminic acid synthase